jgi:hypothetical protein
MRYLFVSNILAGLDPVEAARRAGYALGKDNAKAYQLVNEPVVLETLAALAPDRFGHLRGTGHDTRRKPRKSVIVPVRGICKSPGRVRHAREFLVERRAAAGLPVPASYWTSLP